MQQELRGYMGYSLLQEIVKGQERERVCVKGREREIEGLICIAHECKCMYC